MRTYDEKFREEAFALVPKANWICVNGNGKCFLYKEKPFITECWENVDFSVGSIKEVDYSNGFNSWKDTLFERKWVPTIGSTYFTPALSINDLFMDVNFKGVESDLIRMKRGLVFRKPEEAIAKAKRMLEVI